MKNLIKRKVIPVSLVILLFSFIVLSWKTIARTVLPILLNITQRDCSQPSNLEIEYIGYSPDLWVIKQANCDIASVFSELEQAGYKQWPESIKIEVYSNQEWSNNGLILLAGGARMEGQDGLIIFSQGAWNSQSYRRHVLAHELVHLVQAVRSCYYEKGFKPYTAIVEGEAMLAQRDFVINFSSNKAWLEDIFKDESDPPVLSEAQKRQGELYSSQYGFYYLFTDYLVKQTPGGIKWQEQAFNYYFQGLCYVSSNAAFKIAFEATLGQVLTELTQFGK